MKNIDKIQNLLPLGYLFLVILGIVKESIYYYQIGINIIRYSSIMDILISPIAAITSHPVFFITIAILFGVFFNLPKILVKNENKKWVRKNFGTLKDTEISESDKLEYYTIAALRTLSVFLISLFLGYGLADGYFASNAIKNNKLHYNYKLNLNDEESQNVFILGNNTAYYFYVEKNNPTVKITPISSIRNIELINNRMLQK